MSPAGLGARVRVTIVDDHPTFVYALTALLEASGRFAVVATAGGAADALPLVQQTAPDVLLIDILMPGGNGLDAVRQVRELARKLVIVVLTGFDDPGLARQALEAGADGFLSKTRPPEELVEGIASAARLARLDPTGWAPLP